VDQSLLPPPTATPIPVVLDPEDVEAFAGLEPAERADLYSGAPPLIIDAAKSYTATIATTKGDLVIRLHPDQAPLTVNNFVVLARVGYWDRFPFAYADPSAFALTGSPAGVPTSDIGYTLPNEVSLPNVAGAVGMWYREDRQASSGSQFYVLLSDGVGLNDTFTVFGTVVAGLDLAATLTTDDLVETVTIEER
jgi:cyclophilin family peptidyl-prolyl cis-trans isomerase